MLAICSTTDLSETPGCEAEARLPGEGEDVEPTVGGGQRSVQPSSRGRARCVTATPVPINPGGFPPSP